MVQIRSGTVKKNLSPRFLGKILRFPLWIRSSNPRLRRIHTSFQNSFIAGF